MSQQTLLHIDLGGFTAQETSPSQAGVYPTIRAAAEFCAASVLAVLAAPVVAVLAVLVKLSSTGPVFYTQTRLGLHGRPFQIWKLRTMPHYCEATTGPIWSDENDLRPTPIGRILRDTHLDELPQLWNVLRREMSLIGPRPERPEIARRLESAVPGFSRRLQIKPGLTGLAQLCLPPDRDIAQVPYKLAHDLYYINHHGLLLDARIVISTVFHFFGAGCICFSKALLGEAAAAPRKQMAQERWQIQPADSDLPLEADSTEIPVEVSVAA